MKAKLLTRIESEKGPVIKIVLTVPVGNKEVFALEKGQTYEIELCDNKLPNMELSSKDKLIEAVKLISEVSRLVPAEPQPEYPLLCDRGEVEPWYRKKCIICAEYTKDEWSLATALSGDCNYHGVKKAIYDACEFWRTRNEEDKEEGNSEAEVRSGVDGEKSGRQGISEHDGSEGGTDRAGAEVE